MKLREIVNTIIFESPDTIPPNKVVNRILNYTGAIPFGYYNKVLMIGQLGDWHSDLIPDLESVGRNSFESAGRLWPREKIISFWDIDKNLNIIIKDLNKELKKEYSEIKIDNNWYIDVISFNLLKSTHSTQKSSFLKPLDEFIKESPLGESELYSANWSKSDKYYSEYY